MSPSAAGHYLGGMRKSAELVLQCCELFISPMPRVNVQDEQSVAAGYAHVR
jgi:hypothetical protein